MTQDRVPVCIAVLTVSDTRDEATDKSGKLLVERLEAGWPRPCTKSKFCPTTSISSAPKSRSGSPNPASKPSSPTGGTGLTGRDGTARGHQRAL